MRNPILKGSLLIALGYLPMLGCGGGGSDEGHGIGKGGGGGSAATTGKGGTGKGGSGGTIVVGGTSGAGASSNGGGGAVPEDGCVADTRTGDKATVALYFMIDKSGSMNCHVPEDPMPCMSDPPGDDSMFTTRWTGATEAYKNFFNSVTAADGLWAGIAFFSGTSCDPNDFGPADEIDQLPDNAMDLSAAVDAADPGGQTPTVPALTAAIDHARDWATNHTDQQAVVVYATDGYPMGCDRNNTIDDAVRVAGDGFSMSPSIRTYVLAIGPNLTDLNRVAAAGGTDQAIAISTGTDVGAELLAALNRIRNEVVVDCTYTIPPPPAGRTFNRANVNVSVTTASGTTSVGKDDPSDSTCNGWHYDDEAAPTQIILCGDACDTVQGDSMARLNVTFDCIGSIIEPP